MPAALLIRITWHKLLLRERLAMQTWGRGRSLSCMLGEELSKAHLDFPASYLLLLQKKKVFRHICGERISPTARQPSLFIMLSQDIYRELTAKGPRVMRSVSKILREVGHHQVPSRCDRNSRCDAQI